MRTLTSLLLLGCLLWPAWARATEGLRWQWEPDQERRYLIRSNVRFAELFPAWARLNKNLRLAELQTTVVVRCSPSYLAKKRFGLTCGFDDLQFRGAPPTADAQSGLVGILDEWEASLSEVTVELDMTWDGYLKGVQLDGYDSRMNRFRQIEEHLRLILARSFAGLEVGLPKKGDDKGQTWMQKESAVLQLPSNVGSFGTGRIATRVTSTEGSIVTIDRLGEGSIRSGETIGDPSQGERARNTFMAEVRGSAAFDVDAGELVRHDYVAKAEATASSALATGVASTVYTQIVTVKLLEPDRELELGANEETTPGQNGI